MASEYEIGTLIVSLATPYGSSALAVIRLSGDNSVAVFKKFFSRPSTMDNHAMMNFGYIKDENGIILDQVMATAFYAPNSYTGENCVEITSHGSMLAVEKILALLSRHGFRYALPGEFTYRAFILDKVDLLQAEAVQELVASKSDESFSLAMNRLKGDLSAKIGYIYDETSMILGHYNAHMDYQSEELGDVKTFDVANLISDLQILLDESKVGINMQNGIKIMLAGSPNVGKSSLFNRFLKQNRAIVSHIAGATRDYLESSFTYKGLPITLLDTAGLRDNASELEQLGIEKTKDLLKESDIIIYLIDIANVNYNSEIEIYNDKLIKVANKCDLGLAPEDFLPISVEKEIGIDELLETIYNKVGLDSANFTSNKVLLGSIRQQELCTKALEALTNFSSLQSASYNLDELHFYIMQTNKAIGELLGKNSSQDAFEAMFKQFCLGK